MPMFVARVLRSGFVSLFSHQSSARRAHTASRAYHSVAGEIMVHCTSNGTDVMA